MANITVAQPPSQHVYMDRKEDHERIIELAQPKMSTLVWITPHSLKVRWGTQDTLRPISRSALGASTTPRIELLATPKRNFQSGDKTTRTEYTYSCGRPSMVWEVRPGALNASASPRIQALSQPKEPARQFLERQDRANYEFSCGRASPIWTVREGTLSAGERPRTQNLSQPKSVNPQFVPNKEVQTIVSRSALMARTSDRIDSLSIPKPRLETHYRDPIWPIRDSAKKSEPSPRCQELARSKSVAEGFLPAREVQWQVSRAARQALPTNRIEELSKPIIRSTMDHLQYDPEAFFVRETALKAKCTKRLEELAHPISR